MMNNYYSILLASLTCVVFGCKTKRIENSLNSDSGLSSSSEESPDSEKFELDYKNSDKNIFTDKIHEISIRLSPGTWKRMKSEEHENSCRSNPNAKWWHVKEFQFDKEKMHNVGIKIRGNTSRCNNKLQFKVKFNDSDDLFESVDGIGSGAVNLVEDEENIKNRNLFGLTSISLRSSQSDPSMAVEKISTEIFKLANDFNPASKNGALVYRVGYARVTIRFCKAEETCDSPIKSVYQVTENINKQFFQQRFGHSKITYYGMSLGRATFRPGSFDSNFIEPNTIKDQRLERLANVKLSTRIIHQKEKSAARRIRNRVKKCKNSSPSSIQRKGHLI